MLASREPVLPLHPGRRPAVRPRGDARVPRDAAARGDLRGPALTCPNRRRSDRCDQTHWPLGGRRTAGAWLAAGVVAGRLLCGCRSDMYDQPRYKPLQASSVLRRRHLGAAAGRRHGRRGSIAATRPSVGDRTVLLTGREGGRRPPSSPFPRRPRGPGARPAAVPDLLHALPRRARRRPGDDRPARVPPPPSFHERAAARRPAGPLLRGDHHGHGAMYSYASRIPPRDRWAIAAYIRALQLSQHADARRRARRGPRPSSRRASAMSRRSSHDADAGDALRARLDRRPDARP